jgi:hypothetical protein
MPIRLKCSCGASLNVNESRVGSEVQCPKCRTPLLIAADADDGDEPELSRGAWMFGVLVRAVLLGLSLALAIVLLYFTFRRD